MSQKLTALFVGITPLPWPEIYGRESSPNFYHKPNWDYARHTANVLPELIRRLKVISESKNILRSSDLRGIAAEALRISEEVKEHSEKLTPEPKPQTVKMP